jgi:hypothetical protein
MQLDEDYSKFKKALGPSSVIGGSAAVGTIVGSYSPVLGPPLEPLSTALPEGQHRRLWKSIRRMVIKTRMKPQRH